MESFNDIYDIESPRTSERKMATIENSIHQSLLYNNSETVNTYDIYNFLWKFIVGIIIIGIIIISILIAMKYS